ncbi:diuretic hormone receptor-like [Macrobrachium nipponense]|uniref:diuretic hormone receptor-like n=1 Tax=Macrobrachium nipponense TaxID=159736 RepID=UPI0030C89E40
MLSVAVPTESVSVPDQVELRNRSEGVNATWRSENATELEHDKETQDELTPESEIVTELRKTLWRRFMEQSTVLNETDNTHKVLKCFHEYVMSFMDSPYDQKTCPVKFDGVSCWPETPAGTLREIPCFDDFNGVFYDASENNATLYCYSNGTWSKKSSYKFCLKALTNNSETSESTVSTISTIFYIGNSLSLIAVTLALWIFISFQDLRCLRNTIHTNLLFTYLLHNLFWIVYASVQTLVNESVGCMFFVALNYFTLTNFMWMFVEGFYLYMLVVKTFSVEKIKLRIYTVIGWGVPVPIIICWVAIKLHLNSPNNGPELQVIGMEVTDIEGLMSRCPLMPDNTVDWIQKVPVLLVLSTNFIFLMRIMWVLITKLRSANNVETQRYRKATKALLVLIPLLGLTYMLLIALPKELEHVQAILLSTQGFWVAVFFCFLNSEVQNSVRHHIERWKTERGFVDPRNASIRHARDGSPRPKTGCSSYGRRIFGGKRESLCSEVTIMTSFATNGCNTLQPGPHHLNPRHSTASLPQSCASTLEAKSSIKDSVL